MNTEEQTLTKPKKRHYRRITKDVITRFQAEEVLQGNGTAAVEILEPDSKSPGVRAFEIRKQANQAVDTDHVPNRIQQIAVQAVERINDIVNSTDERVALSASEFIIDHAIGKAVQRNDNVNLNVNIENLLH